MTTLITAALEVPALPLPPSLNNAYTNGAGHGRRVLTTEARQYKATASLIIRSHAARVGFAIPPKAPLRIAFRFYFARNNRDGDNAVKLVQDAAAEALGFNDLYVVGSAWEKAIDKTMPRCDLRVEVVL